MKLAIVSHHLGEANRNLAAVRIDGVEVQLVPPDRALGLLGPGDVALARLDVRETLDGIEEGLSTLSRLEDNGVTVLNPPGVLMSAHDKLLTARALERNGLSHPETEVIGRLRSRRSLSRSCSSPGSAAGAGTSSFAEIAPSSSGG